MAAAASCTKELMSSRSLLCKHKTHQYAFHWALVSVPCSSRGDQRR